MIIREKTFLEMTKTPGDASGSLPGVFARYHRDLLSCCTKILGNPEDAEDVVQMVFLQFHRKGHQFRAMSRLRSYLFRIAINQCRNEIRRQKSRRHVSVDYWDAFEDTSSRDTEMIWLIEGAITKLKASLRIPLVLHEMEGMSYSEISGILSISETGVRSRIHRARKKLRRYLEKEGVRP